jgi:cysteine synthase A
MWEQTGKKLDGFVCSSGTGGTIGGCSRYLKQVNPSCKVYCIDPPGSGLHGLIERGQAAITPGSSPSSPADRTPFDGDRVVRYIERSKGDSITEGIGIDRVTANFASGLEAGCIDGCLQGDDHEAIEMAFYCLRNEGVFIGPSAALNVVGAVKLARQLKPGSTVCTVLCDGGDRYASKMYNPEWLAERGLQPVAAGTGLDFIK